MICNFNSHIIKKNKIKCPCKNSSMNITATVLIIKWISQQQYSIKWPGSISLSTLAPTWAQRKQKSRRKAWHQPSFSVLLSLFWLKTQLSVIALILSSWATLRFQAMQNLLDLEHIPAQAYSLSLSLSLSLTLTHSHALALSLLISL